MNTSLPLAGVRVVDLTRVLSGPFCSMLLGDLGADIVKVETPGEGDTVRHQGAGKDGPVLVLRQLQPQQALDHAEPAHRRRPRDPGAADREQRRAGRQLPPRRARRDGLYRAAAARTEPAPGARQHHRLRHHRAVSRPTQLRFHRPGDERLHERERCRRSAADALRPAGERSDRRPLRGAGHRGRPAARGPHRRRADPPRSP